MTKKSMFSTLGSKTRVMLKFIQRIFTIGYKNYTNVQWCSFPVYATIDKSRYILYIHKMLSFYTLYSTVRLALKNMRSAMNYALSFA